MNKRIRIQSIAPALLAAAIAPQAAAADELRDCMACHAPDNRQGEVPVIEGQHAEYLKAQLQRFRDRHRQAFPMDALARGLDDAAIERIADALSQRPWRSADASPPADAVAAGERLIEHFQCTACHGDAMRGGDVIPRVAGQQPGYLARQIHAFVEHGRYHPPTGTGARMYSIDADEAAAIGAALHAMGERPAVD